MVTYLLDFSQYDYYVCIIYNELGQEELYILYVLHMFVYIRVCIIDKAIYVETHEKTRTSDMQY